MSPELTIPLTDAEAVTVDNAGPKAATLARLSHARLPVPEGVCLTAEAYRRQIGRASCRERVSIDV